MTTSTRRSSAASRAISSASACVSPAPGTDTIATSYRSTAAMLTSNVTSEPRIAHDTHGWPIGITSRSITPPAVRAIRTTDPPVRPLTSYSTSTPAGPAAASRFPATAARNGSSTPVSKITGSICTPVLLKTITSTTYTLERNGSDPSGVLPGEDPGKDSMAKRNDLRPIVKLRSTAGTGFTYVTRKNRRNNPDRLVMRKYDPAIRQHVDFREER
jgi:large subunit ribosomal protein L33